MTKPPSRTSPSGRASRLAAAAAAVGLSVGIANGMALAANSEVSSAPATEVVQRIVVVEPEPIVVVIPRVDQADPAATSRPAIEQPPAPTPAAAPAQTEAPVVATESGGS